MKKLLAALAFLCLLAVFAAYLPALAQPLRLPHENPNTAIDTLDTPGLFLSYVRINNLVSERQFQSAEDFLQELKNTVLQADIQFIFNQCNELYHELYSAMEDTDAFIAQATALLDRNQLDEAIHSIDAADLTNKESSVLLKNIETATNSLSEILGVFQAAVNAQITEAHDHLTDSIGRLEDLTVLYDDLVKSLTAQYQSITDLLPSEISLTVNPQTAFVGDNVTASGTLRSNGAPLAGKCIYFTINDKKAATATTGPDGSYLTDITLPYEYINSMTLYAIYEPSGDDFQKYLPDKSQPVTVTTLFYPTRLKITAPDTAYRELPFTITGEVLTDKPAISRDVAVYLDNTLIIEEEVSGSFRFEITAPPDIAEQSKLIVSVRPNGRYSGAAISRSISFTWSPVYLETSLPSAVLLPGTLAISGKVTNDFGPIANATVRLKLRDSTATVTTASDGTFRGALNLHLLPWEIHLSATPFHTRESPDAFFDLSPLAAQGVEITIESNGRLIAGKGMRTLTINPLSSALILVVMIALIWVVRKRIIRKAHPQREISPPPAIEAPPIVPAFTPPASKLVFSALKSRIISAYRNSLSAIEKLTGVIMAPHTTLREFVQETHLPLPSATERFVELTTITENALYSTREPPPDTAARAEELAATIKEELFHGTP